MPPVRKQVAASETGRKATAATLLLGGLAIEAGAAAPAE
ncbi:hypothetical protein C7S16_0720 [Burkholderia thailandensis]|uniref:Uncharacterized protein n=1 Tax=Burkholderia thailandensis TaxID=57975 RepID=A0AAW9CT39_BURTH|nr:hypothetical protein [Burkholderia thailandensis]MDW9253820.1 hypothetical protein [Burkholderia thailandensis]